MYYSQLPLYAAMFYSQLPLYAAMFYSQLALYVSQGIESERYDPPPGEVRLETLWLKIKLHNTYYFLLALYHPPKPLYLISDLLLYIGATIDIITSDYCDSIIVVAGDLNPLSNDSLCDLGLIYAVKVPTHRGHMLDGIYSSQPVYCNVEVIKSLIKPNTCAL